MSIWLCTTDETMDYPENVVLMISKQEDDLLEKKLNGELDMIVEFDTVGCDMVIPSNAIVSAENITEEARALKAWIVSGRVCARCKSLLLPSRTYGYKYQCPRHDEDLMSFETVYGRYTPRAFQNFLLDFFNNKNMSCQTEFYKAGGK